MNKLKLLIKPLFSKENLSAVALFLIIILMIIVTSDQAPEWIYQGF